MNTTIKVSRKLCERIIERSKPGESREQTIRRELQLGATRRKLQNSPVVLIKLSQQLRRHIRRNALPSETVDMTLRRLLEGKTASSS